MDTKNLDRAKQFMAFEALSGLREAYEEKEREEEIKFSNEFNDEMIDENSLEF